MSLTSTDPWWFLHVPRHHGSPWSPATVKRRNRTKACCELLINDYTRRGFVDGRVARLPTVIPRPERRGMEVKLPCAGARKVLLECTRGAEVNLQNCTAPLSKFEFWMINIFFQKLYRFSGNSHVKICEGTNWGDRDVSPLNLRSVGPVHIVLISQLIAGSLDEIQRRIPGTNRSNRHPSS